MTARFLTILMILLLSLAACREKEDMQVKNYYSAGTLSTQVISYTPYKAVVRLRFFVWDRSNADGVTRIEIADRISYSGDYAGSFDSLKRIFTPSAGPYSAAVIFSNGLDDDMNMNGFFEITEPVIRKICHASVPGNEILLARAGNRSKPVEIIGGGFTRDATVLDQELAAICKTGNYIATDSLSLLKAMDSVFNYLLSESSYANRHCIIMISRREKFWQDMSMVALTNKALHNGIHCHLIDAGPSYNWDHAGMYDFLKKLYVRSSGLYYSSPFAFNYNFNNSELPMDMLQVAGNMPGVMQGGVECFEIQWTIEHNLSTFYAGHIYEDEFVIRINTNAEQVEIPVTFRFYIN